MLQKFSLRVWYTYCSDQNEMVHFLCATMYSTERMLQSLQSLGIWLTTASAALLIRNRARGASIRPTSKPMMQTSSFPFLLHFPSLPSLPWLATRSESFAGGRGGDGQRKKWKDIYFPPVDTREAAESSSTAESCR